MKMTLMIIAALFTITTHLDGQAFTEIKDVDILSKQHLVLETQFPLRFDTVEILGTTPLRGRLTKVSYLDEGAYCEVILNSDRKDMLLVAMGVYIPGTEVPGPVLDAFRKSEYGNRDVTASLAMRTPYGPWFYAVDVNRGDTVLRLFYDELGHPKKAPY